MNDARLRKSRFNKDISLYNYYMFELEITLIKRNRNRIFCFDYIIILLVELTKTGFFYTHEIKLNYRNSCHFQDKTFFST